MANKFLDSNGVTILFSKVKDWVDNQGFMKTGSITGFVPTNKVIKSSMAGSLSELEDYAYDDYVVSGASLESIIRDELGSYLTKSSASSKYQPKDTDLTAIAGLTGTKGLLKKNGDGSWSLDTNTYLTSHQSLSGYAKESWVNTQISNLVNSAPEALNTLGELATALKNHEDAYGALLTTVGNKLDKTGGTISGVSTINTTSNADMSTPSLNILHTGPKDSSSYADLMVLSGFNQAPYGFRFKTHGSGTAIIQSQRINNDGEVFPLSLNPNGGDVLMNGKLIATQSWVSAQNYAKTSEVTNVYQDLENYYYTSAQTDEKFINKNDEYISLPGLLVADRLSANGINLTDGEIIFDVDTVLRLPSESGTLATRGWVENKGYVTSIPTASSSVLGGIKIGYTDGTTAGSAVQKGVKLDSNNKAYIEVTKKNITDTLGYTPANSDDVKTYSVATADALGLIKVGFSTSGNNIAVQVNNQNKAFVTVPLSNYLPKSGGSLSNEATLKFTMYGSRTVTISGNSIDADMSADTGTWAGNFATVKHSKGTTTMLGWYGSKGDGLYNIFMGGSYDNPAMKMDASGNFTFKNTITGTITNATQLGGVAASSYATTSSLSNYLPLSGGTMTGLVTLPYDKAQLQFRGGHASYDGVISYQSAGNEAMVFSTKNVVTSFMFVNGEDTITNVSSTRWKNLTPGLQIKNNKVSISKLIADGVTPTYNLDVGGTANATTIYENETALSEKYQSKGSYVTTDTTQTISGAKTYTGNNIFKNNLFEIKATTATDDSWIKLTNATDSGYYAFGIRRPYATYGLQMKYHPASGSDVYYNIWHEGNFNPSNYLTTSAASSTYQAKLTSGTNIKSINNTSLLGSGNINLINGNSALYWSGRTKLSSLANTLINASSEGALVLVRVDNGWDKYGWIIGRYDDGNYDEGRFFQGFISDIYGSIEQVSFVLYYNTVQKNSHTSLDATEIYVIGG